MITITNNPEKRRKDTMKSRQLAEIIDSNFFKDTDGNYYFNEDSFIESMAIFFSIVEGKEFDRQAFYDTCYQKGH